MLAQLEIEKHIYVLLSVTMYLQCLAFSDKCTFNVSGKVNTHNVKSVRQ